MKRFVLAALIVLAAPVYAQAPPQAPAQASPQAPSQVMPPAYEAPDQELWEQFKAAMRKLPVDLDTHQVVQNVLANVEREAQARAQKKKAPPK